MSDKETLNVYDAKAEEYVKLTSNDAHSVDLTAFIQSVKSGGHVLDFGCGPGHYAAQMALAGLITEATDASSKMVKLANQLEGVSARCEVFDDLDAVDHYDGIFANFSLLHAPRDAVARHITQMTRALKAGGIFHIAMKLGSGETRDRIGRRYCYFTESELEKMMNDNGLSVIYRNSGCDKGLDGAMANWVSLQGRK